MPRDANWHHPSLAQAPQCRRWAADPDDSHMPSKPPPMQTEVSKQLSPVSHLGGLGVCHRALPHPIHTFYAGTERKRRCGTP